MSYGEIVDHPVSLIKYLRTNFTGTDKTTILDKLDGGGHFSLF